MTGYQASAENFLNQTQDYWNNWFKSMRDGMDGETGKSFDRFNHWGDFTKRWHETVHLCTGLGNYGGYMRHFEDASKAYLDMMQKFATVGQNGGEADVQQAAQMWAGNIKSFFENAFAQNLRSFDVGGYQAFADQAAKFQEQVGSFFKGAGLPTFGGMRFGNMAGGADSQHFNIDPFGFFAAMPGIGYTREKQEEVSKLYKLAVAFEQKFREYNAEMARVGIEAAARFQQFLVTPPEGQEPLTSIKAVYAKWVDISEDVYADFAMSERYTVLYGEVVNALMNYRKQMNLLIDGAVDQVNLPTRTEIDSVHKRVHDLKRENQALKRDIAALKAAVGLTDKAPAKKPAATAAAAKTVTKKKGRK